MQTLLKSKGFGPPCVISEGRKFQSALCVCAREDVVLCVCGGGGGGAGFDENEEGHSDNEEGHSNNEEGDSSFL